MILLYTFVRPSSYFQVHRTSKYSICGMHSVFGSLLLENSTERPLVSLLTVIYVPCHCLGNLSNTFFQFSGTLSVKINKLKAYVTRFSWCTEQCWSVLAFSWCCIVYTVRFMRLNMCVLFMLISRNNVLVYVLTCFLSFLSKVEQKE